MNNLTAIILLCASLGLFFGYVNPTYGGATGSAVLAEKSIKELKEERARYEDALAKAHDIETALTGLLDVYNGIPKEDLEKLTRLLPDHIDSVRLIIDINNIASQYGMTLRNITLTDEAAKPAGNAIGPSEKKFSKVGIRFALSGSYDKFRSFLSDLEQSLRLVDIETIAFSAKEEKGSDAYEYSVVIATYKLD